MGVVPFGEVPIVGEFAGFYVVAVREQVGEGARGLDADRVGGEDVWTVGEVCDPAEAFGFALTAEPTA